jgi:hypothetical protein
MEREVVTPANTARLFFLEKLLLEIVEADDAKRNAKWPMTDLERTELLVRLDSAIEFARAAFRRTGKDPDS